MNNELGMIILDPVKVSPIIQHCINIRKGFEALNKINAGALKLDKAFDKFNNEIEKITSSKKEW